MADSYADMWALRTDDAQKGRIEMCVREQGGIFANDGRADIATLGRQIVAGSYGDIDSVAVAVCTSSSDISTDPGLLGAVQEAFPRVAAARYPQG